MILKFLCVLRYFCHLKAFYLEPGHIIPPGGAAHTGVHCPHWSQAWSHTHWGPPMCQPLQSQSPVNQRNSRPNNILRSLYYDVNEASLIKDKKVLHSECLSRNNLGLEWQAYLENVGIIGVWKQWSGHIVCDNKNLVTTNQAPSKSAIAACCPALPCLAAADLAIWQTSSRQKQLKINIVV